MNYEMKEAVLNKFASLQDSKPVLIESPAVISILGDHSNYNDGFVLAGAVDRVVYMALGKRQDHEVHFYDAGSNETFVYDLKNGKKDLPERLQILSGILNLFKAKKNLDSGFNCVFATNISWGPEIYLNSALHGAFVTGFNQLFALKMEKYELARISQSAEPENNCARTLSYLNILSRANHLYRFDARAVEGMYFPFDSDRFKLIVCDSGYQSTREAEICLTRQKQCEEGVKILGTLKKNILSLRDISHYDLDQNRKAFSKAVYKRCRFIIRENIRVLNASGDIERNDYKKIGQRMSESHTELSGEYEVSSPVQDLLVRLAQETKSVLGARMLGAAPGGATINLVKSEAAETFIKKITDDYHRETGKSLSVVPVSLTGGSSAIK